MGRQLTMIVEATVKSFQPKEAGEFGLGAITMEQTRDCPRLNAISMRISISPKADFMKRDDLDRRAHALFGLVSQACQEVQKSLAVAAGDHRLR